MNKYTSYRVQVRPPNNHVNSNNSNPHSTAHHEGDIFPSTGYSAVLRRYSDFLWLHSALQKERAGAILPPLPEKQAVSRFSLSFIEERRGLLERFLRRVAVHPELYDSVSLDTFLRADDATFFAAKNSKGMTPSSSSSLSSSYHHPGYDVPPSSNPHNNNMAMSAAAHYPSPYGGASVMGSSQGGMMTSPLPPKKKEGIKKWFAETKTSIAGELVRSPDDDLFVEIERYVEGLEKQIKQVQTQASSLVKKNKEIANGLFEFGIAFNILGQSEADDLGKALSQMGAAADELSSVSLAHSEKEMLQFEEPLKDYLKTIHSVKAALQKRHEKRLTYTTCLSEVNTKRTNLAKLRATPGAEAKAYGAEMSLRRGEAATNAARDDFATVSQRVLREVDRFKREKGDEMRRVILDYINLQIEYNKKMEQVWADLLPKLEAIQSLHGDDVDSSGCDDGTSDLPPSNVVTTTEKDEVHDFSNSNQVPGVIQQQQQQPSLAQFGMNHQNMFGLESSIQYRDTTDIVSGM
jgi:sorting nexin-1/2